MRLVHPAQPRAELQPRPVKSATCPRRRICDLLFYRKLTGLKVGDAFTRTIEIVADGTQAMFLPPTSFPAVKGLSLYPKAPDVENITRIASGFVAARRTASLTR